MADEKAPAEKKATKKVATDDSVLDSIESMEAEVDVENEKPDYVMLPVRDQEFRLVTAVPAVTMMKLSAASDPRTSIPKQMDAMRSFLERVVVEDDREAFMNYLEDADPVIDFEEINKILSEASELMAARPTQP